MHASKRAHLVTSYLEKESKQLSRIVGFLIDLVTSYIEKNLKPQNGIVFLKHQVDIVNKGHMVRMISWRLMWEKG